MTSLKIYLQQSHKFQDFSHNDKSVKKQATLVNAQGHLYEGTRQNMHVTKHNNADQTFWIFYFLCV